MGLNRELIETKLNEIKGLCNEVFSLLNTDVRIMLLPFGTDRATCIIEFDGKDLEFTSGGQDILEASSRALAEAVNMLPLKEIVESSREVKLYTNLVLNKLSGPGYETILGLSNLVPITRYDDREHPNYDAIRRRVEDEINHTMRGDNAGD